MRLLTRILIPALLGGFAGVASAQVQESGRGSSNLQPNFLIIIADDVGVDIPSAYAEGANPACMPCLETLASQGMLFRNAWAMTQCSPMRASLLTGLYPYLHGIGEPAGNRAGLRRSHYILPELLSRYDNTQIGKWHLAGNLGDDHPNNLGFFHYSGSLGGGVGDYFNWTKITDGQSSNETNYATTVTTDESITAVMTLQEPWLLITSYNAVHAPFHEAPSGLCPNCPGGFCGNLGPNPTTAEMLKSVAEAMDQEMSRLIATVDAVASDNTFVFFIGDNGTPRGATEAPFIAGHAKGSLYEGGVNVPFVVRGPGVAPGTESAALISVVDVFNTLSELSGAGDTAEHSVSMVPYFSAPKMPSIREFVYAEKFSPVHDDLPFDEHTRAVRNGRFKLIRETGRPDELYDLRRDVWELNNLLPDLNANQQLNHDALVAELVRMGVD